MYLFDCGLVRYLRRLSAVPEGTDAFGSLFEHWVLMEIRAYRSYREKQADLFFWRESNNAEVDLLIRAAPSGPPDVAIEIKSADFVQPKHLKAMRILAGEYPEIQSKICVSLDPRTRQTEDGIRLLHWREFAKLLWKGEVL